MTTYIFVLLFIIIFLLFVLLMRRPTVDISALREDNARLRERLAERLGALSQNAIELKNIARINMPTLSQRLKVIPKSLYILFKYCGILLAEIKFIIPITIKRMP